MATRFRAVFPCVLVLGGCNAITGVDNYQFGGGGSGGQSPVTSSGGNGAGGATCEVALCAPGSLCCSRNQSLTCTDVSADTRRCGSCSNECDQAEWCDDSMCKCRPGLTGSPGNCVDPLANPASCGGGAACAAPTPACEDGACVAACSGSHTNCSDGCFDTNSSPLHCGSCTKKCPTEELCVGGECLDYQVAVGCRTCPCETCKDDFDKCCEYPGTAIAICVNHDATSCP